MAAAAAALFPPTAGRDGAEAAVAKATTGRERRGGASLRPARKVVADEDQTSALGQNPAGVGMGTGRAGAGLGGGAKEETTTARLGSHPFICRHLFHSRVEPRATLGQQIPPHPPPPQLIT